MGDRSGTATARPPTHLESVTEGLIEAGWLAAHTDDVEELPAKSPVLAGLLPGSDPNLTSIGIAAATLGLVAGTRKLNRLVVPKIDKRFFRDAYDTRRQHRRSPLVVSC